MIRICFEIICLLLKELSSFFLSGTEAAVFYLFFSGEHRWNDTYLGILVGWPLAAQVGPLNRCLAPVVVVASGWIRDQVPSRRIPPFPSYELCRLFWRSRQFWHFYLTWYGTSFQPSITLFEKKFLLISSLAACCLRILNVCSMSVLCRRSSSVVRRSSLSLSSYDWRCVCVSGVE